MQIVAARERKAHVDDDQHVDTHAPCERDRQVVDQSAVHEQAVSDLHWRQHARRRHAGAEHGREIAAVQDDGLAGLQVRGQRAERRRQPVEILRVGDAEGRTAQGLRDLLALHEPERQLNPLAVSQPQRAARINAPIVLLAPVDEIAPRRAVAKQILPVELAKDLLDLGAAQSGAVQPANHRAHARAGDCVDRHLHLLQRAYHTDVRRTARTAAAQHQPDLRSLLGRSGVRNPDERDCDRQSQASQQRERSACCGV